MRSRINPTVKTDAAKAAIGQIYRAMIGAAGRKISTSRTTNSIAAAPPIDSSTGAENSVFNIELPIFGLRLRPMLRLRRRRAT